MSPLTFDRWLLERLRRLYSHLDEEGAYVHANTVAVVIEQIEADALEPVQVERYAAYCAERDRGIDEQV